MRVLIVGANGFVGQSVSDALRSEHSVIPSYLKANDDEVSIDLQNPATIADALARVRPEAIVDCAGIVENTEKARLNPVLTNNLLAQVVASGLPVKRIVVMGSAGEYGEVKPDELPVREDTPRRATSLYGMSKAEETDVVMSYRNKYHLPVVVARLFNPIGVGMHQRMIIPRVLDQIDSVRAGTSDKIEVNRLDSVRDYIDARDMGTAIVALLGDKSPRYPVYNVGSGVGTSNEDLIKEILKESDLSKQPKLVETSIEPEPLVASQADISRLHEEFGWSPKYTVMDTVRSIVHVK